MILFASSILKRRNKITTMGVQAYNVLYICNSYSFIGRIVDETRATTTIDDRWSCMRLVHSKYAPLLYYTFAASSSAGEVGDTTNVRSVCVLVRACVCVCTRPARGT